MIEPLSRTQRMELCKQYTDVKRAAVRGFLRHAYLDGACLSRWLTAQRDRPLTPNVQFLLLHHVFDDEVHAFRELLESLSRRRELVSYSQAIGLVESGSVDRPTLAISFDDGVYNCLQAARVLSEFGVGGCFFVCPARVGESNPYRLKQFCEERLGLPPVKLMDWDDLAQLKDMGQEVGGHTLTHPIVSDIPHSQAVDEISECRERLVQRLGAADHFAWPRGDFSAFTARAAQATFRAGYRSCASGVRGSHLPGSSHNGGDWIVHRQSILATWPLRHIEFFLQRAENNPHAAIDTWPPEWLANRDQQTALAA